MEEYLSWLIIALVGIGAGAYGVLVGAGGGFILSPVLLLLAVSDPKDVPGTVLAAIAINGAFVAWTYRKVGIVDYRSGLLFAAAAVPGAVIGALGVKFVSSDMLKVAFGVLLVLLAVQLAIRPWLLRLFRAERPRRRFTATVRSRHIRTSDGQEYRYEFNEALATSFNVVLGFISSFFGIGGGFLRTPILVIAFSFSGQGSRGILGVRAGHLRHRRSNNTRGLGAYRGLPAAPALWRWSCDRRADRGQVLGASAWRVGARNAARHRAGARSIADLGGLGWLEPLS